MSEGQTMTAEDKMRNTREPQCRTKADVLRRFADTLDMCEAEGIAPSYKYDGQIAIGSNSSFGGIPEKYEFMLAIVEGRPVFRGDVLYEEGNEREVVSSIEYGYGSELGRSLQWKHGNAVLGMPLKHWSWTSLKPATISVNGVEVNAPNNMRVWVTTYHEGTSGEFHDVFVRYSNKADAEAFKAAIEGGK